MCSSKSYSKYLSRFDIPGVHFGPDIIATDDNIAEYLLSLFYDMNYIYLLKVTQELEVDLDEPGLPFILNNKKHYELIHPN